MLGHGTLTMDLLSRNSLTVGLVKSMMTLLA